METTPAEIDFIKSILVEDKTSAYVHFLNWQKKTNFNDNFPDSITIYLPYLYVRFKTELKENSYQKLYEGLYKKNILINSLGLEIVKKISNYCLQNHIQHSFLGSLAISKLLDWDPYLRKLAPIECIIELKKIKPCIEFLKGLGYGLSEKKPKKKIFQLNLNKTNYPKIIIYIRPIKFEKKGLDASWLLSHTTSNTYQYPSAEKVYTQKAMNLCYDTQWHHLVDCLLLLNTFKLKTEIEATIHELSAQIGPIEEAINETQNEMFERIKTSIRNEKKTATFKRFLLNDLNDYKTKTLSGRLALQANHAGVLDDTILSIIAWFKILKEMFNKENLFL